MELVAILAMKSILDKVLSIGYPLNTDFEFWSLDQFRSFAVVIWEGHSRGVRGRSQDKIQRPPYFL